MQNLPNPDHVLESRRVLAGVASETPLLRSDELDRLTRARVFLKCENLQRTGAFKFRGAYNCLSRMDKKQFPDGVVAYSTGNHGQAVATVGKMLGIQARIVMPSDAPAVKIAKARRQGAEVILYDRYTETREAIAAKLAENFAVKVVPPGDDPHIIAGQGTAAAEAIEVIGATALDTVLAPCGGGGLAAGTCLAVQAQKSSAQVWAVEPAGFDDTRRSLISGQREKNATLTGSICDALLAPTPAELPFRINKDRLSRVLSATDEEVLAAMHFAYEEFRIVLEPGGAIALAAVLADPKCFSDQSVLVLASGGNVDPATFERALSIAQRAA
jgi:threonine dehydratase